MAAQVNATRMELLKLKNRLKMALRGHKLLKDKRDELMKTFINRVRENRRLRELVEHRLAAIYRGLAVARATMGPGFWETALAESEAKLQLLTQVENVMSVHLHRFELKREGNIYPYGLANTSAALDVALASLNDTVDELIRLAEVESAVRRLAQEIEKTRRRVNALEYVLIPQLQQNVRDITMRLSEMERSNISRLMKIKEIVRGR